MTILEWLKNLAAGRSTGSPDRALEDDSDLDPFNPFPEPIELEITDLIDLHTIPPRDVKRVVEEYLLQAHDAGFRSVRIIHGKGIGVQRELVRKVLQRTSFVAAWTDAPPDAGGLGATIAHFK
jgi:dsDNA-specific endonuclease/ATPase MutS2